MGGLLSQDMRGWLFFRLSKLRPVSRDLDRRRRSRDCDRVLEREIFRRSRDRDRPPRGSRPRLSREPDLLSRDRDRLSRVRESLSRDRDRLSRDRDLLSRDVFRLSRDRDRLSRDRLSLISLELALLPVCLSREPEFLSALGDRDRLSLDPDRFLEERSLSPPRSSLPRERLESRPLICTVSNTSAPYPNAVQ